jgi:predicted amidohydrolase
MESAHAGGASLVHFPEGALSGYVKRQIKSWDQVDWHLLEEELQATAAWARELRLWVVLGCNHRLTVPNRPHNSLYVLSPEGKVVTRYDKRYCSHSEISDWYTPGRIPCVFQAEGWRFGCALCIEIQFPEVFQEYSRLDVDCVLFSAYADTPMFGIQAQGYAASHNYWISVSVPAQRQDSLTSRLIGPAGEVQAAARASESAVVTGVLDEASSVWDVPLRLAKPWRAKARRGEIYQGRYVDDPRSSTRTSF